MLCLAGENVIVFCFFEPKKSSRIHIIECIILDNPLLINASSISTSEVRVKMIPGTNFQQFWMLDSERYLYIIKFELNSTKYSFLTVEMQLTPADILDVLGEAGVLGLEGGVIGLWNLKPPPSWRREAGELPDDRDNVKMSRLSTGDGGLSSSVVDRRLVCPKVTASSTNMFKNAYKQTKHGYKIFPGHLSMNNTDLYNTMMMKSQFVLEACLVQGHLI